MINFRSLLLMKFIVICELWVLSFLLNRFYDLLADYFLMKTHFLLGFLGCAKLISSLFLSLFFVCIWVCHELFYQMLLSIWFHLRQGAKSLSLSTHYIFVRCGSKWDENRENLYSIFRNNAKGKTHEIFISMNYDLFVTFTLRI